MGPPTSWFRADTDEREDFVPLLINDAHERLAGLIQEKYGMPFTDGADP